MNELYKCDKKKCCNEHPIASLLGKVSGLIDALTDLAVVATEVLKHKKNNDHGVKINID